MGKFQIGEFEEVVLLTVGILHGNAYGVTIRKEIEERLGRTVSVGALQITLRRMEEKGYLKSNHGEKTEKRGGRPKLYFTITPYGKKTIAHTRETRNSLWEALPNLVLNLD
ncbi:MAG: PadR family transcriptional regulator [Roseivirga sp.]|nr:PadR family transcriptional regulator [Roseivirga sp.]